MRGKVYLVGAGPGDPGLLTLRAAEVLGQCDVVLVDALVHRGVLKHVRAGTEVLDVGKRGWRPCVRQEEIHRLLIEHARLGRTVARLKGGDPFIFGRGGEEAEALEAAGIPWEAVPGVTAGIAAASYAGIPLLHRKYASSVVFVTGRAQTGSACSAPKTPLDGPAGVDTVVVFMCGKTLARVARSLLRHGRPASTPAAVIRSGTWRDQEVFLGTLEELAGLEGASLGSPVLAVIGAVAGLATRLHWFGVAPKPLRSACQRPTAGTRVEAGLD
jgi:uroporphyrin-III C-methyltransferase